MSNRNKQQHNPRPGGGAGARYSNDNKGSRNEFSNGSDVKGNRGSFGERRAGPNVPGADLYAGPMMMPPPQIMPPVMPGAMMMNHPGGGPGMMPPPGIPGQGFPIPFTAGAPTYDLPVREKDDKKKFTGRCRLFVAGIPPNVKEDDIKNLFEQYGEVSEVFLGKQNSFAFVKMDTRKHAEEARDSLDNKNYEGRTLRVRLAAHAAAVRVKNLSQVVTNELLEHAFSLFGEVERAVVITDDRGRSVGEGIVEFARKVAAQICLKRCSQECFLLTANPAPVIVEPFEQRDEEEGFSEKHINRNSLEFKIEREVGPRFADPASFEFDFGSRFKQLYEIEREKRARLDNEINDGRRELMEQMEFQRVEYQKKILKDKLREMEEKVSAFEGVRNRSLEEEKVREEQRQREEISLRQREEELLRRNQFRDFQARQEGESFRAETSAIQDLLSRDGVGRPEPPHLPPPDMGMFGPGGARGPFGGPSQDMMDNPYPTEDPFYGLNDTGHPMEIGTRYGGYHGFGGMPGNPPGPPRGPGSTGNQGHSDSPGGRHFNRPAPYGAKGRRRF